MSDSTLIPRLHYGPPGPPVNFDVAIFAERDIGYVKEKDDRKTVELVYSPRLSEITAGGTVANGRQIEKEEEIAKKTDGRKRYFRKEGGGEKEQENWMRESRQTIRRSARDLRGVCVFTVREGRGRRKMRLRPTERFDRTRKI